MLLLSAAVYYIFGKEMRSALSIWLGWEGYNGIGIAIIITVVLAAV